MNGNYLYAVDVNTPTFSILNIYTGLVRCSVLIFVMISGAHFLEPKRDLSYDNEQYTISIVGYLSTKGGTQKQFDDYLDAICEKLGELRFRPTTQDSPITPDTGFREWMLTAYAQANTLEGTLRWSTELNTLLRKIFYRR